MRVIGALLALVCAGLGALQVYVASQRHAEEFAAARGVSKGILSYEFAASPADLFHSRPTILETKRRLQSECDVQTKLEFLED